MWQWGSVQTKNLCGWSKKHNEKFTCFTQKYRIQPLCARLVSPDPKRCRIRANKKNKSSCRTELKNKVGETSWQVWIQLTLKGAAVDVCLCLLIPMQLDTRSSSIYSCFGGSNQLPRTRTNHCCKLIGGCGNCRPECLQGCFWQYGFW